MAYHKNSSTTTVTHAWNITTTWKRSCQKGSLSLLPKREVYFSCQKGQSASSAKKKAVYLQEEEAERITNWITVNSLDPHELLHRVSHLANPGICKTTNTTTPSDFAHNPVATPPPPALPPPLALIQLLSPSSIGPSSFLSPSPFIFLRPSGLLLLHSKFVHTIHQCPLTDAYTGLVATVSHNTVRGALAVLSAFQHWIHP